ncbi:hypothetical protein GGI15_003149 [Coemansia interrupta]|uniref:Uncharacterized protein n=1 Tax=Coemansia interrupta TaxID=1126814 RepID=A0A9W8H8X4_9FUNG|nr:hypothetical protein GGI15_003149 [Coemansia interrupta]
MEYQTRAPAQIPRPPPARHSIDRSNRASRESWGLGITLSKSQQDVDFEQAAATMGLVTSHFGNGSNANINTFAPDSQPQQASAFSFFSRLANSISSMISSSAANNNDNGDEDDSYLPLGSKTQIEDMLESYYLSQGREVPEWVHDPPPDPPLDNGVRNQSYVDDNLVSASSKSSSKEGSNPGVISRGFARLNIGRFARPQAARGLHSSSASVSEGNGAANAAIDSGFNSPVNPPSLHHTPSINVEMVGEDNRDRVPLDTPETSASFQLDSDQLAASVSESDREGSPGYFSPRRLRKPYRGVAQFGSPISLSSLMPSAKGSGGKRVQRTDSQQSRNGVGFSSPLNDSDRAQTPRAGKSPLGLPANSHSFWGRSAKSQTPTTGSEREDGHNRRTLSFRRNRQQNEQDQTYSHSRSRSNASSNASTPMSSRVKRLFRRKSSHS